MQSSFASTAQPEEILEWLQNEMGYRQLGLYSTKHSFPSSGSIRKVYRGNMIPFWDFMLKRIKSEKTVDDIRKNIIVHGTKDSSKSWKRVGREKSGSIEVALREREFVEKEMEMLRWVVRRKRNELKDVMVELSRELKRMLDERANCRHIQVMLEAYEKQCDDTTKVFSEYHKRLRNYVSQANDAQKSRFDSSVEMVNSLQVSSEKGGKSDTILIETDGESKVRKACESIATLMSEKIQSSLSAYEGSEIHPYPEVATLGFDSVRNLPNDIEDAIALIFALKC